MFYDLWMNSLELSNLTFFTLFNDRYKFSIWLSRYSPKVFKVDGRTTSNLRSKYFPDIFLCRPLFYACNDIFGFHEIGELISLVHFRFSGDNSCKYKIGVSNTLSYRIFHSNKAFDGISKRLCQTQLEKLAVLDPWLNCSCFALLPATNFLFWIFWLRYNFDIMKFWVNCLWSCPFQFLPLWFIILMFDTASYFHRLRIFN